MRVLAIIVITMATLAALGSCASSTGPRLHSGSAGCLTWCRHKHNPTEYFCCRADPNSQFHHGQCPQRIVSNNGMNPSYCLTDHHCQAYEKCCYSPYSRQTTCVSSVTNRHQPKPPVINARFGGGPVVANNFDELGFDVTYRRGNEGWDTMGGMEPMK